MAMSNCQIVNVNADADADADAAGARKKQATLNG